MKKQFAAVAVLSVLLIGCSKTYTPIKREVVNRETGEVLVDPDTGAALTETIGYTTDSHVAREHDVHETLRNRDREYRAAHKNSGFTMKYQVVKINGSDIPLPVIDFRETPRFEQPLPVSPSEHPVWKFANNVAEKGLWAWLGYNFFDFGKEALAGAKESYNFSGDNQFNESFGKVNNNINGRDGISASISPYTVDPQIVEPAIVYPEVFGPASLEQK